MSTSQYFYNNNYIRVVYKRHTMVLKAWNLTSWRSWRTSNIRRNFILFHFFCILLSYASFFIVLLLLLHTHAMNNVCNNKRKRQVVHASIFITITREDTLFFCYGTHIYFEKGNVFALTSIMLFVWCIASFFFV